MLLMASELVYLVTLVTEMV